MSQRTLISQPGLQIERVTGTEGPRHDPYSYEEWIFDRGHGEVVYHVGLSEWIEYRGERHDQPTDALVVAAFLQATQYTFSEWQKFLGLAEASRYRRHRGHDVRSESGYPGEHFTVCHTCGGEHIDSYFSIGEVE